MQIIRKCGIWLSILLLLCACDRHTWNDPHPPTEKSANVRYTSFSSPPKTLDPAVSYSEDSAIIIAQIYEPPLQYHYLLRPYTLVPLTATAMPTVEYWDKENKPLAESAPTEQVAYTTYEVHIQPGIYYQPHPAFAKNATGEYLYHHLTPQQHRQVHQLSDFPKTGTRELTADDYVYEIKRLASPRTSSPIFGLMSKHIVGLPNYADQLRQANQNQSKNSFLDLRNYPLAGATVVDRYTYRITIQGKYPSFIYWLAMPFFAPVPWEADAFYSQPSMAEHNINFDWYPIGTGPFVLTENNPNRAMVLDRNPNFHAEYYPSQGEPKDIETGLLADAGKQLPLIDKVVFSLEKETIPRWNKFLQGYYDLSAISSDSYDQAIYVDQNGQPRLTPEMKEKGIRLQTSVEPSDFYIGFNMLDDVVGGYSERAQKLRQAIGIAINYEEFIKIFLNGRGIPAQGPIPPGIFGYLSPPQGMNPYLYSWQNDHLERLSMDYAKQLLAEAGYPNGRDAKTGKPLILNYDVPASNAPDDKSQFDWMRQQFAKLGVQLNIEATQYNRFQQKMQQGDEQLFFWGWSADYPDPENFLFLFYGPNGKVKFGGENAVNYTNADFDKLFEKMRVMPNSPERQEMINQMLAMLQRDAPWVWGFHTKTFILSQQWNGPNKPMGFGNNALKYQRLDPLLRAEKQRAWNEARLWPLIIIAVLLALLILPVIVNYWRRQHHPRVQKYYDH